MQQRSGGMSSKLANKASHPSGRKAMQAVRASHKEERMRLHKIGAQSMLKPWHVKALWFKVARVRVGGLGFRV